MADFCNQCAKELGLPEGDLANITPLEAWKDSMAVPVLCESCGPIQVDPDGNCASDNCLRPGHSVAWLEAGGGDVQSS